MKLKILLFFSLSTFFITSAALAMPQIMESSAFSEPGIMLLFGIFLIVMTAFGRKVFFKKP